MEIGPLSNRPIGTPVDKTARIEPAPSASTPTRSIRDVVEISENARARLAERADEELSKQAAEAMGPVDKQATAEDRLAIIRQRIESGYYDNPDVRRQIAERIIDDLEG